ncbi:MAG: hypothetical protein ABI779_07330 [Acidobacteriota bacterium]
MRLSKVATAAGWMLIALWMQVHAFAQQKIINYWGLTEHQPEIPQGGRASSIAIHPQNQNEMLVASDSGGLFKSTDGGRHWAHVDSLPVIFTQAVAYLPSNPDVILVTAKTDFKQDNGGGVWRSSNGGGTWQHVNLIVPDLNIPQSAYGISALNDEVVVGATDGVFVSHNGGLDWTHSYVFFNGTTIYSVLLTPGTPGVFNSPRRIYAGGPAGLRLGTLPLSDWVSPILDPGAAGGIQDIHAISNSPLGWNHAFVVNGARQLFRTEDRGNIWTLMPSAPAGPASCGGTAFVKARLQILFPTRYFHLYFGNRCGLHHFSAPMDGNTAVYSAGTWEQLDVDHAGPRDFALSSFGPALLATNGGLHNSADQGHTWRFVGGGSDGYNALQITDLQGQFVGGALPDLYLGTRDNNLWALNVFGHDSGSLPAEGFHLDAERKVPSAKESRITYMACNPCRAGVSGQQFHDAAAWPNAPGGTGAPVLLRRGQYVQNVATTNSLRFGLALTESAGGGWQQFGVFSEEPRGLPKLARQGAGDHSIVYQAFRSNFSGPPWEGATRLLRVQYSQGNGVVVYPAMANFGGLGVNSAFASYPVFGVDSRNWFHVIAPDIIDGKMRETWNGGEDWTEIPGLTDLVTRNGELQFIGNVPGIGLTLPLVTAVSFCPDDPTLVLVGTSEGGIYFSGDRGKTWKKVPNSERATYVTSFFWQNTNTIYVSTFGRGLWKLGNRRIAVEGLDELCPTCAVVSNDGTPDRPPFDGGVLAFDGRVLGVRTEKGQLREVFVTPGSSVVFTGDPMDPQNDIAITESDGRDTSQMEALPNPPKGAMATGVVFTSGDQLTGTVFTQEQLTLLPPDAEGEGKGSTVSPTKGTPYLRLTASSYNGTTTAAPGEAVELSATGLVAGASYEVLVDGVPVKGTLTADGNGSLTSRITAPSESGAHSVALRLEGQPLTIDGSTFVVRNEN